MKYWVFLFLALLQLSCSEGKQQQQEMVENSKPNIVFILVDDLGKEWISSYGAEDINTPNIDALAKSGMKFDNVYSMPQCTPTRVTLLTGQYPFRHGWVNHWDVPRWGGGAHFDEKMNPALVKEIKKAGYKTCIAGKWQIDDFRVEPDALNKVGFDDYCMWTGYESGIAASSNRYQDPYVFTSDGSKTYEGKFGPDVFRDFITGFINKHKASPMFIYYPMVLTHPPLVNTPDEVAETKLGKHKAMVNYTDKITGQIVQSLEDAGVRDNTIIVWTTDNGTSGGIVGSYKGKKINGAKSKTTEQGICEPFIVSWPKAIKPNQVSDALIDFTDILPTFIELAGGSLPTTNGKGESITIDGKSFKNILLNNEQTSERQWILGMGGGNKARLTENGVENQFAFRDRVLRNKQYKLYIGTDRKPRKFFDLKNDSYEEKDILLELNTPERKTNFEQLAAVVSSFPDKDSDPKYIPNSPQPWDVEVTAESQAWKK